MTEPNWDIYFAADLRRAGWGWEDIARELGVRYGANIQKYFQRTPERAKMLEDFGPPEEKCPLEPIPCPDLSKFKIVFKEKS